MRLNQEAQQNTPANDPTPEPIIPEEKTEDQPDLLYSDGDVTEEIITDDIHAMEKWLGKGSLDCYRFDRHGNEYRIELIIRRAGLVTNAQQLSLQNTPQPEKETA